MATTANRNYPLVSGGAELAQDVLRLIAFMGMVDADVQAALQAIAGKADLAGPAFTSSPTAPTPVTGDDSNRLSTTAFVNAAIGLAIANLVGASPAALDTLNELAAALGNNPNFATTVATQIGLKANSADVYLKAAIDAMVADMATKTGTQTLANKTLTSPTINTPSLILKNSAGAAPTTLGELQWDSTTGRLKVGTGSATKEHAANNEEFIREYDVSGVGYVDIPNLSAFKYLKVSGCVKCSTSGAYLLLRQSADNGVSFDSGSNYGVEGYSVNYSGAGAANYGSSGGIFCCLVDVLNGIDNAFSIEIENFNKARRALYKGMWTGVPASTSNTTTAFIGGFGSTAVIPSNALRFLTTAGVFTDGYIRIKGIRG